MCCYLLLDKIVIIIAIPTETFIIRFSKAMEPIVLIHGGAGEIPDLRVQPKLRDCKLAAKTGYNILKNGGSVLDAVEAAVKVMEDSEAFNAGLFDVFLFIFYHRFVRLFNLFQKVLVLY